MVLFNIIILSWYNVEPRLSYFFEKKENINRYVQLYTIIRMHTTLYNAYIINRPTIFLKKDITNKYVHICRPTPIRV